MPPKKSRSASALSTAAKSRSKDKSAAKSNQKRSSDTVLSEESPVKRLKTDHKSHTSTPGVVLTVGEGDVGQLGLGPDVLEKARPALVELPSKCIQIVAGGMHTACLTTEGEVYTFGCNDEGALGRTTTAEGSEAKPGKLTTKNKFIQISAGDSHTAMLTSDGLIFASGTFRDANGSIGLTEAGPQKTAINLPCPKRIMKIASGSDHLLALSEDGLVFSSGCAEQGQLGRVAECFSNRGGRKGLGLLLSLKQIHFKGTKQNRHPKFCDVWAGTYVSFAKSVSGDIYAWGLNNYYQLGIDDMVNRFVPELVKALPSDQGWQGIAGGQHHTVAVNKDGEVFSIGRGTYGQLGLGESNAEDAKEPKRVSSLPSSCLSVDASSSVSFAVCKDGKSYGWGMGTCQQLSNGEDEDKFEPVVMTGKQLSDKEVLMISSGGQHTVLLAKQKADVADSVTSE